MKVGSLFSGAGLGDFGFEMAGLELAWQCEVNPYARKILDLRWPDVKKYEDIKAIKTEELEPVDLITGGFPCQPFSVAGKQLGSDDNRNLWPEMFRIIEKVKPRWVVAENVPGIIPLYLDTVLADLGSQGYTCWPVIFSSHSLGAWHRRERLWIMANATDTGVERMCERKESTIKDVANTNGERSQIWPRKSNKEHAGFGSDYGTWKEYWKIEPSVGRVAHGITNRVDRLKCLGNGQTPCSTYVIGKWLMELAQQK